MVFYQYEILQAALQGGGADWDIHHDFQVEWTLGSQDDIQVLLNNETVQFSYSQGEQDLLLSAKRMWGGTRDVPIPWDQPCPVRGQPS